MLTIAGGDTTVNLFKPIYPCQWFQRPRETSQEEATKEGQESSQEEGRQQ